MIRLSKFDFKFASYALQKGFGQNNRVFQKRFLFFSVPIIRPIGSVSDRRQRQGVNVNVTKLFPSPILTVRQDELFSG
jgi:hypothetical protein